MQQQFKNFNFNFKWDYSTNSIKTNNNKKGRKTLLYTVFFCLNKRKLQMAWTPKCRFCNFRCKSDLMYRLQIYFAERSSSNLSMDIVQTFSQWYLWIEIILHKTCFWTFEDLSISPQIYEECVVSLAVTTIALLPPFFTVYSSTDRHAKLD